MSDLDSGAWPIRGLIAVVLCAFLLGCGGTVSRALPDQRLAYKEQREARENLEIPPDLIGSRFNDELDIPTLGGAATFSDYAGGRAQRQGVAADGPVLPAVPDIELRRRDDQRWLEVQQTPQALWPRLISFWREQGILLVEQDPAVGVMRTDWLDNRAAIRQDFLTRMISRVMEGVYATSTRDQYSLRIERGTGGRTEIFLTHRGMEERLAGTTLGDGSRTIWEPSGRDPEKEAEMLRRLMLYLGAPTERAASATAATGSPSGTTASSSAASRLITEAGTPTLVIEEDARRGWRTIGLALDRAGFAVEDRDISQGIYYVRYAGEGGEPESRRGMLSRLAFWRGREPEVGVGIYQVRVSGDENQTQVRVTPGDERASAVGAERILTLLHEQVNARPGR